MLEADAGRIPGGNELTSPFMMETLLREAVVATNESDEGHAVIPYTRTFHDLPHHVVFRRRVVYGGVDKFSLDLGVFSDSAKVFYSVGYVDFGVRNRKGNKRHIGILCLLDPTYVKSSPFRTARSHAMTSSWDGIHVSSDIRGNGVGKSLISAARVVLDEVGVRVLMIDQIKTGRTPGGEFYRHLAGREFSISKIPAMCMPAYQTSRLPYVFS